jgi:hypothetical protein
VNKLNPDNRSAKERRTPKPVPASARAGWRLVLLLGGALFALPAPAQQDAVPWFKIAGGGGTSTNGQFTVSGAVGQHDAGGPRRELQREASLRSLELITEPRGAMLRSPFTPSAP